MTDRNTNRPGYKKTKVGWIPEEWNIARLDQLACISTGDKDTQDRQIDGKYPFFVRSETIERINSYSYDGVAVLTAGDGVGTGKVFHYIDGKFDFHQRVYKVSDFSTRLNSRYFFNYFRHNFLTQVTRYTAKNSVDSIRREMIAGMPIPLPPLPEQKKIAEILSTWDEGIEQTRQLIAAAKRRKKALMQKLLTGRKRLKGFKGNWQRYALSTVCSIRFSGVDKKASKKEIPVRLCNYTDVYYNNNITLKLSFMVATATETEVERFALHKDDVLLTKDSETADDIAKCAYVAEDMSGVLCGYHLALLRPTQTIQGRFLCHALNSPVTRLTFSRYANGVTRFGLPADAFDQVYISVPAMPEQRAIAAVLATADEEIAALEAKLDALDKQKHGLMQKLLTGQMRVTIGGTK